jgi:hypothetical protein
MGEWVGECLTGFFKFPLTRGIIAQFGGKVCPVWQLTYSLSTSFAVAARGLTCVGAFPTDLSSSWTRE